jgi:hypothetical protein
MVFVTGSMDRSRNSPQIIVDDITPIDRAVETFTGSLKIRLLEGDDEEIIRELRKAFDEHRGACPVLLEMRPSGQSDMIATVRTGKECCVSPSRELVDRLEEILGQQDRVLFLPKSVIAPKGRNGNRGKWKQAAQPAMK